MIEIIDGGSSFICQHCKDVKPVSDLMVVNDDSVCPPCYIDSEHDAVWELQHAGV